MDISRYKELKVKGHTKLEKDKNEKIEIVIDRFDVATGDEIESEREDTEAHTYNLQRYKEQMIELQAKIDNVQELVNDIEKFKGGESE